MDTPNNRNRRPIVNRQPRLQPAVKAALRSIRRQDNKESILVNGTNDPRIIRKDILVTKVVEALQTAATTYTPNSIYKLLDNGTTPFFTTMRIISVSAYGSASSSGEAVTVNVTEDGASFTDHGVFGAKRAAVHIRFPENVRINWRATSATTPNICTVTAGSSTEPVPVQFTIEVRGDASGSS
jgi:hypothetical protein